MARTKIESTTLQFQCSLINRQVRIFRDYTIIFGSSGEEAARAIAKTECENMDDCPIATHNGMTTSYDWPRCMFVKAQSPQ